MMPRRCCFMRVVLAVLLGLVVHSSRCCWRPVSLSRAWRGCGSALAAALAYSNAIFVGAIPIWMTALLAAALRGAGLVRAPAVISLVGAVVLVPLSPLLIFGWGPIPRFGIAAAVRRCAIYSTASALALLVYLCIAAAWDCA